MTPEELQSRILYRDALILVINKPSGLPVHAASGKNENLVKYLDALRFGLPRTPSLAHRLDRDTSGCLILGRHTRALALMNKLFTSGKVDKTYWAVVMGGPAEDAGLIDIPLGKLSEQKNYWHMTVDPEGKPSQTLFKILVRGPELCLLELTPLTGRTHQLRLHCAASGYPIIGDVLYGGDNAMKHSRHLHLHARGIVVPLYPKKAPIHVEAPLPDYFEETVKKLHNS